MEHYNIEINTEQFFNLLNNSLKDGNQLNLGLLLNAMKSNPNLCQEVIMVNIPASSQTVSSTYFDKMIRSNRFDFLEVLLSHESMPKNLEKILKKGLNNLLNINKSVKYFSEVEYAMKKYSIINGEEDIEDSNFPTPLSDTLQQFSCVLTKIATNNEVFIKSFLNLNIERLLNDKDSTLITQPTFFTYLKLFEHTYQSSSIPSLINWQATDSNGQNILFYILDYPPALIDFIVSQVTPNDWECKNDREKTPSRRLAETDFTKYHYVKRLNHMLSHNQINFDNNDFRIMFKRVIKSYKLKTNSIELNEEIKNTFTLLNNHTLINSAEGEDALEFFNKSENAKFSELTLALLNKKLQTNLEEKPVKHKLKI